MPSISAILLTLCLCGCATRGAAPPADTLVPCEQPGASPRTNGELLSYTHALRKALKKCAAQVDAIREWAE